MQLPQNDQQSRDRLALAILKLSRVSPEKRKELLTRANGLSERVEIGKALEGELQGRREATLKQNATDRGNFPPREQGKTRDLAAKAAGFGNGKTYE